MNKKIKIFFSHSTDMMMAPGYAPQQPVMYQDPSMMMAANQMAMQNQMMVSSSFFCLIKTRKIIRTRRFQSKGTTNGSQSNDESANDASKLVCLFIVILFISNKIFAFTQEHGFSEPNGWF
jgi:hypothetical protein